MNDSTTSQAETARTTVLTIKTSPHREPQLQTHIIQLVRANVIAASLPARHGYGQQIPV
jgi:hypothetical protein